MKSRPVKIRLPETWLAKIEERCREEGIPVKPPPGKTGGPAEWIRRIIAKEINEEMFDPHTKLPIQKGQKNFAHGHNLRVWLVDKNLYPKGNPMGLGLVVNSADFLGRLQLRPSDLAWVCSLTTTPTKALRMENRKSDWDPAEYIIVELHRRNNLGLKPGFYHVRNRNARDAVDAYGRSAFTTYDPETFAMSDEYTQIVLQHIEEMEREGQA